ncbi:GH92 family glycosyl hydrolase [Carboxylicivirga sp. A043]|uniref:GH92 family glycosyl hydrolase n=1 Tax=Carboxylicivirga litoralis TaxID=2816963 RepID=UPI0021CB66C4|nr:GH92 family glycosyl hydrolase [Carboxylicivirga sp. A043]MCU4154765.1 GH92 family glycosyl hydrolase [Carboxylicivirga sp. A043]
MKRLWPVLLLTVLLSACNNKKDFTQYVDPFIGTGAHGHTYPGAQVPFGMVQLSPDTRNDESWDGCGGYHYSDSSIIGFSHTHLSGTGVSDYGDVLLMPIMGELKLETGTSDAPHTGYRSIFSHDSEVAKPGYYSVYLDDYQVKAELTAGKRVGYHRYTFDEGGVVQMMLDLIHRDPVINAGLSVTGDRTIVGERRSKYWAGDQRLYFAIEFSKPFLSVDIYNEQKRIQGEKSVEGKALQSVINFQVQADEKLEVKVALSMVSTEGAVANLQHEATDINFDQAYDLAKAEWQEKLGKIEVEGGTLKEKRNFYTALYHSLLTPNLSQDVDGSYRGMDGKVHKAEGFTNYTVFSLWDTFRTLHPLLTIIEPELTNDFVKCLVQKSKEYGELPMWELASNDTRCMIGYHAVSLITDAYAKGIRDYDLEEVYAEMRRTAMLDKRGMKDYRTLGYVPSNKSSQGVSKTLEYAYNDWCVAQVAQALGKKADYHYFMNRSKNYRNIYDPSTGFMRGKMADHSWVKEFDPMAVGYNYTEGNSYQYSLFVPHDVVGLTELLGGQKELEKWLDRLFETDMAYELEEGTDVTGLIGQYAHGNEPSHHMAYLYNHAAAPWKTQFMARHIMATQYNDSPAGLCGNEDCGQMSAWYVMSAMGLYPDNPGSPYYSIGSPIFDKIIIHLDNAKTFEIAADNNKHENVYIQNIQLNGSDYHKSFITHQDMLNGGVIKIQMSDKPNKTWFQQHLSNAKTYQASPHCYLTNSSDVFVDKFVVDMRCDDEARIHYTLDGSEPNRESSVFKAPFTIKESTVIKMRSYKEGCEEGYVVTRHITKEQALNISRSKLKRGLRFKYYEGIYRSIYDYAQDMPAKTGVVMVPTLDICDRQEWIGVAYDGLIYIPQSGTYTFYISANDGCMLKINGEEQFESDGRKSFPFAQKCSIELSKGHHHFEIGFYQCSDGIELKTEWEGPGIKRQTVPASIFFHQ